MADVISHAPCHRTPQIDVDPERVLGAEPRLRFTDEEEAQMQRVLQNIVPGYRTKPEGGFEVSRSALSTAIIADASDATLDDTERAILWLLYNLARFEGTDGGGRDKRAFIEIDRQGPAVIDTLHAVRTRLCGEGDVCVGRLINCFRASRLSDFNIKEKLLLRFYINYGILENREGARL